MSQVFTEKNIQQQIRSSTGELKIDGKSTFNKNTKILSARRTRYQNDDIFQRMSVKMPLVPQSGNSKQSTRNLCTAYSLYWMRSLSSGLPKWIFAFSRKLCSLWCLYPGLSNKSTIYIWILFVNSGDYGHYKTRHIIL